MSATTPRIWVAAWTGRAYVDDAAAGDGHIWLDTPAWFAWLDGATRFAYPLFDPEKGYMVGVMTARKETRARGACTGRPTGAPMATCARSIWAARRPSRRPASRPSPRTCAAAMVPTWQPSFDGERQGRLYQSTRPCGEKERTGRRGGPDRQTRRGRGRQPTGKKEGDTL